MPVEQRRAGSGTSSLTDLDRSTQVDAETDGPWCTVVWNDPVNLMSYVVFVLRRHFGYSRLVAEQLMMQVHEEGRATVSRGSRERMETDVQAMHSFGLQATLERVGEG
ncbi:MULTISPECIES: ATP-dependent Clp protease adapter ClpS [Brachybacterium]|uniref:ATP-dependent Clp protease adapter protein ClpS n=1 Tax=Brachybacterium alimentarium TaxID=47845 RepID=A0A2A3YJ18_9MICO|nr:MULTISPECIES: ATP-dependent Clp protease adapter ClpS [Brachybacterium]PCC35740.1 ATP-dependent Clp protease adapter ClpS [Brachybacterium alimentarium]PCC39268.1 ATP-dependent Clp protease adapter ClpS [Brachybacterium alimentarium]RCS63706.1 ATP-dependent Clp protease adapter ClpS [Brachybacterium alimentarium]RCS64339.1 ATP-dependent Clp protease adapter ClpS [Brachybacterium sp. JB7]RCS67882.1 ATP-dependent Clp protease adapter ClpS [Brachybacterium alimentarium]